jgi:hypothetical protein
VNISIFGESTVGVEYSIFFESKMSCKLLVLLLFLGLLLLRLWSKKNSRILEFLFKGLVFLNTSLDFSMLLNSGGFVEEGFLNVNTGVFSVVVLCFDISRCFLLINNESAGRGSDSGLLTTKEVCGRDSGVGNTICISPYLGVGVLTSMLEISLIFFCATSPCLVVGVLKISDLMFSIWI